MSIRTTLTLDEDVAAKLREESQRAGTSFKKTVNSMLRAALNAPRQKAPTQFRVHSRALSPQVAVDYDNIAELLEMAEEPLHR